MPLYPKVEPYVALKQGIEYEERAELDCGCVMQDHEDGVSIELYFCTLHNFAQQLLDALDQVASRAYRGVGPHEVRCRFCTLVIEDPSPSDAPPPGHEPTCPMNVVHQIIRQAKGGDAQQAG